MCSSPMGLTTGQTLPDHRMFFSTAYCTSQWTLGYSAVLLSSPGPPHVLPFAYLIDTAQVLTLDDLFVRKPHHLSFELGVVQAFLVLILTSLTVLMGEVMVSETQKPCCHCCCHLSRMVRESCFSFHDF